MTRSFFLFQELIKNWRCIRGVVAIKCSLFVDFFQDTRTRNVLGRCPLGCIWLHAKRLGMYVRHAAGGTGQR